MIEQEPKFPIPTDNTLLSDLDNTLVKGGYTYTLEDVVPAIKKAKVEGLKIGLSSDTPFEALEVWRERFSMNGPLIAEKGAIVGTEGGLIYNKDDSNAFLNSREAIIENAFSKDFVVWKGNPVEALRTNISIGQTEMNVLLVNDLRRCSLGFFFRKVGRSGNLEIDQECTSLAMEIAREHYPIFETDEDFNKEYGLVIVAKKEQIKEAVLKH